MKNKLKVVERLYTKIKENKEKKKKKKPTKGIMPHMLPKKADPTVLIQKTQMKAIFGCCMYCLNMTG
jgi:hypothetical protein